MPSNFRTNTYSPLCKRSTYGSYIDDNNLLKLAQPHQMRPIYNNGILSGYMNETESYNYCFSSILKSNSGNRDNIVTTQTTDVIGPDGTYNDVYSYSNGGFFLCDSTSKPLSFIETQTFIASIYVKMDSTNTGIIQGWTSWECNNQWPRFSFTLDGEIKQNDYSGGIKKLNSDWMRVWWCTTADICSQDNNVWFILVTPSNLSIYISHAQVESVDKSSGITTPSSWIPYFQTRDSDF